MDIVRRAARLAGIPYQTYLKEVAFRGALQDLKAARDAGVEIPPRADGHGPRRRTRSAVRRQVHPNKITSAIEHLDEAVAALDQAIRGRRGRAGRSRGAASLATAAIDDYPQGRGATVLLRRWQTVLGRRDRLTQRFEGSTNRVLKRSSLLLELVTTSLHVNQSDVAEGPCSGSP